MSMNVRELDGVLQKVAELRVFFDFGQKTVPLLDDVASFVSEIGPAVESMKALVHVASTKIPKASEQLVRVNQTSEQASNDILNTIDRMVSIIEEMENQGAAESSPESVRQTAAKVAQSINVLVEQIRMGRRRARIAQQLGTALSEYEERESIRHAIEARRFTKGLYRCYDGTSGPGHHGPADFRGDRYHASSG